MNIAEILKDCPKGTKLYSPLFGNVFLHKIDNKSKYPIIIRTDVCGRVESFSEYGTFMLDCPGECMLFPSKDNKDWSTFKVHKKEYEFKPFDKVLVRNTNVNKWRIDLFSNINDSIEEFKYICIASSWNQCIPYEGNEHLLDTTNNPD